jgi:hypothetical protein
VQTIECKVQDVLTQVYSAICADSASKVQDVLLQVYGSRRADSALRFRV